ncbi:hypothetical protein B0H10DRAFT_1998952 [Mycena sp. CBHHK59/15]|nr:hypothetical protein B0H10DRAFT_1998952 [Mycena sp. CBHHK59/15]
MPALYSKRSTRLLSLSRKLHQMTLRLLHREVFQSVRPNSMPRGSRMFGAGADCPRAARTAPSVTAPRSSHYSTVSRPARAVLLTIRRGKPIEAPRRCRGAHVPRTLHTPRTPSRASPSA